MGFGLNNLADILTIGLSASPIESADSTAHGYFFIHLYPYIILTDAQISEITMQNAEATQE